MGIEFTTTYWDETTPSGTSQVRQTDDEFVSVKSSIRSAFGNEHEFSTAVADHVRGTHKQGSARAWVDVESNLSVSGTSYIGRLYITSDTSRLFAIPASGVTLFLGSSRALEHATALASQNSYWCVQTGTDTSAPDVADGDIVFSPAFDSTPHVALTSVITNLSNPLIVSIKAVSASAVTYVTHNHSGASAGGAVVHYHAVGPVTF